MTLGNLGVLAARAGDLERGRSLLGEALALFEETDDAPGQMGMRLNLGNIAADAGEPERARELLEASRRAGRTAAPVSLRGLGDAHAGRAGDRRRRRRARGPAARRRRSSSLRPLGDRWGVARCLELDQAVAKGSLSPARQG